MVNWKAPDVILYRMEAKAAQQRLGSLLGDRKWDVIEKNEVVTLYRKVGYGLFGPPTSEPTVENHQTGYTQDQLKAITIISTKLLQGIDFRTQNLHFACIFIICKSYEKRFNEPVFKSKPEKSASCIFVDSRGRIYKSWSDHFKNNQLPKCIYCYPIQGVYELVNNEFPVRFDTSPACDVANEMFSFLGKASSVVAFGAAGVGLAALCTIPVAGPLLTASSIAGISTGVFSATQGTQNLIDRATHGQSIALKDSEARSIWLSVVCSTFGVAHGGMSASLSKTARAGEVMGKAGRIAFMAAQAGHITADGLEIINTVSILAEKSERNELTSTDVCKFIASVAFFSNSVITAKTAKAIIIEIQSDIIRSHRDNLSEESLQLFNRHTEQLRGNDQLHGNARVVKSLNRIENTQDLYNLMVDPDVEYLEVTQNGYQGSLNINDGVEIQHPLAFLELQPDARQEIITLSQNLNAGTITPTQFIIDMGEICTEYEISFEQIIGFCFFS